MRNKITCYTELYWCELVKNIESKLFTLQYDNNLNGGDK